MTTIYTLGYGAPGWTPEALLGEAQRLRGVILDCRNWPNSRRPEWNRAALERTMGRRYQHCPGMGNELAFRGGIRLADPRAGLHQIRVVLETWGLTPLLMCQCREEARCHLTEVAELCREAFSGVEIRRLEPPAPAPQAGMLTCLSVRQPWAWALMTGIKDVENRDWRVPVQTGQLLGIHASKGCTRAEWEDAAAFIQDVAQVRPPRLEDLRAQGQVGALLGTVEVVGLVERGRSPWFVGRYGIEVRRPRLLDKPLPMNGRLGLFEVMVPEELLEVRS